MHKLTPIIIFVSIITAQDLTSSHQLHANPIALYVSIEKCLDYRIIYPRNDPMSFNFNLEYPGNVSIMIYSLEYEFLRVLVSEQLPIGFHKIYWDGLDENNKLVQENVYLHICKQKIL